MRRKGGRYAHLLRAPREHVIEVDGENVMPQVHAVLDQMEAFSSSIRSAWKGYTGKRINRIASPYWRL